MGIWESVSGNSDSQMTSYPSSHLRIQYNYVYSNPLIQEGLLVTGEQNCTNQGSVIKTESVNIFSRLYEVEAAFYTELANVWHDTLHYK